MHFLRGLDMLPTTDSDLQFAQLVGKGNSMLQPLGKQAGVVQLGDDDDEEEEEEPQLLLETCQHSKIWRMKMLFPTCRISCQCRKPATVQPPQ